MWLFLIIYFRKIFDTVKNVINVFLVLKLRTNILVLFNMYVAAVLITLIIYGYLSSLNIVQYKKNNEIDMVSRNVRHAALSLSAAPDLKILNLEAGSNDILSDGIVELVNQKGDILYSAEHKGMKALKIGPDFMQKLGGSSGFIEESETESGKRYVFYDKASGHDYILLYAVPSKLIEKETFPVLNFILYSTCMFVLLNVIIVLIFKNKVYNPIVNVEKIIHGLVDGDTDLKISSIGKSNPLYPLYSDLNLMTEKLKNLIGREYSANIMKKQAELDALQSQINPHFLYNTLETIRGQAITEGAEDIEIMTKALSDLFRYSISKNRNLVRLEEELKNVENYLMIQQYRFNNKFIFINNVDMDTLNYRVPKLLIQPIVENAVQHGLEIKEGKGTITISAYITEKRLIINIQDDGVGMSNNDVKKINDMLIKGQAVIEQSVSRTRIGLFNVNERIKLNFGENYGIRVYSAKDVGTNIEVVLPLISE